MLRLRAVLVVCATVLPPAASAAPIIFSDSGPNAINIQDTVDAFRAALGDPNNGNNPGPLAGGRREINWDGGGANNTTGPVTPFNVFLNTRGSQYTTPGAGLSQGAPGDIPPGTAPDGGLATLFNNPSYATSFDTFSPLRLFVPVGSNIIDVVFSLPGTNGATEATVSGFGGVFSDVDLADTTRMDFFAPGGGLLLTSFVEENPANASLSFLGVQFDAGEQIGRVRITLGNLALGPNANDTPETDVVALDDVLYSEPQAVPEPSALALLLALAAIAFGIRFKH